MFDWLFGLSAAIAETAGDAGANVTDEEINAASGMSSIISMVLMIVLMVAVFYFMLIRPQKKKDKQVKAMLDALKPGDRITTIGGIYGTIKSIKDDTITLMVGHDQMEMVVARWAIRGVEEVSVENEGEILA